MLALLGIAIQVYAMPSKGKNKALLGQHEYEIREDVLSDKTEITEESVRFQGIEKIVSTRRHIFVFLGSFQGMIIPIYGIIEGDFRAFEKELKLRVDQAGG